MSRVGRTSKYLDLDNRNSNESRTSNKSKTPKESKNTSNDNNIKSKGKDTFRNVYFGNTQGPFTNPIGLEVNIDNDSSRVYIVLSSFSDPCTFIRSFNFKSNNLYLKDSKGNLIYLDKYLLPSHRIIQNITSLKNNNNKKIIRGRYQDIVKPRSSNIPVVITEDGLITLVGPSNNVEPNDEVYIDISYKL